MSNAKAAQLIWIIRLDTIMELTRVEESDRDLAEILPIVVNRLKLFDYADEDIEYIIEEYFGADVDYE